jgi:hypothetical protein
MLNHEALNLQKLQQKLGGSWILKVLDFES